MRRAARVAAFGGALLAAAGCGGGGGGGDETEQAPATYTFPSRFDATQSSVSYTGQVHRHALILELVDKLVGLGGRIDPGGETFDAGDFETELATIYDNTASIARAHSVTALSTPSQVLQTTYAQLDGAKHLREKTAGNDASTDYKDWDAAGAFEGWSSAANALLTPATGFPVPNASPEALIRAFFATADGLAVAHSSAAANDDPIEPGTATPIERPFITADGLDLRQLIQKLLLGAVAFSQGCDDYFDDDAATPGKGLLAANVRDGTNPFTVLEHQWDEGYGYFGAVRDLFSYTDAEYAGSASGRPEFRGAHDTNGDGSIDLLAERGFGHSVNAASRDRDSHPQARTDFTGDAFAALVRGRAIIANAPGALTPDELDALRAERNALVLAWEQAIAATIVHYINLTIQHTDDLDTVDYDFLAHAQHWGEMKGFALGLQFNPRSPVLARFVELHGLLGDRPVHAGDAVQDRADYKADLLEARDLIEDVYGFDPLNMGDANGLGGW